MRKTLRYPTMPYKPTEPNKNYFIQSDKEEIIYRDVVKADDDTIEYIENYFEDNNEPYPNPPKRHFENLTLQDLVDLAPPNTELKNIIIKLNDEDYFVDFKVVSIQRDLEKEEASYQAAMKKYEERLKEYEEKYKKYEEELKEYDKNKTLIEIAELEEKIKSLKSKL